MRKIIFLLLALPLFAHAQEMGIRDSLLRIKTEAQLVSRLEELKKKFNYYANNGINSGWYTHKWFSKERQEKECFLMVNVNSKGIGYLQSLYFGADWIFHGKILCKIDGKNYLSNYFSPTSENNEEMVVKNGVVESVSYINSGDNGIIIAIAYSKNHEIIIQYMGTGIYVHKLTEENRTAIIDSLELMSLLMHF